ncbi:MAG: hypothetical protein WC670_20155 [Pseudolabrys sp.]|jgi:hypothetical protein
MTKIDWIFFAFCLACGLAAGAVTILVPQSNMMAVSPYFWVLIAVALFETVVIFLRGFDRGPPLSMRTRLLGFGLAIVVMVVVRMGGGVT